MVMQAYQSDLYAEIRSIITCVCVSLMIFFPLVTFFLNLYTTPEGVQEPYGVLGIKPMWAACKANAQSTILSLQPMKLHSFRGEIPL